MDQNRSRCDNRRFQMNRAGQNQQSRTWQNHDNRMMQNNRNSCDCGNTQKPVKSEPACRTEGEMQSVHLAMAYMPWQKFGETFSCSDGFQKGTIFPELYKPFLRGGCGK